MSISEAEQLALIEDANRQMAERAKAPGWYHAALGLLVGGLCAAQALPLPGVLAYYLVYAAGLALLVQAYKRKTGMWVMGYRKGRTRWVALTGGVLTGLIFLAAMILKRQTGEDAPLFVGAAIMAVVVTVVGYVWEAAYRRDLGVS